MVGSEVGKRLINLDIVQAINEVTSKEGAELMLKYGVEYGRPLVGVAIRIQVFEYSSVGTED